MNNIVYLTPNLLLFKIFTQGKLSANLLLSKANDKMYLSPSLSNCYCYYPGPLLKSICQQISYFYMLPFEAIPDDTVPVTAFLKVTKSNHWNSKIK